MLFFEAIRFASKKSSLLSAAITPFFLFAKIILFAKVAGICFALTRGQFNPFRRNKMRFRAQPADLENESEMMKILRRGISPSFPGLISHQSIFSMFFLMHNDCPGVGYFLLQDSNFLQTKKMIKKDET